MIENAPATGIALEALLPLGWSTTSHSSKAGDELRRHGNIALLRALAALESTVSEHEHNLPESAQKTLDRLEAKLDIVLAMMAEMARASMQLPPEKQVSLFSDHIVWTESDGSMLSPNQRLLVHVYLSQHLPQPLQLSVTVTGLEMQAATVRISAQIDGLDEELEEWLTRTIFRHHRRALQARRQL